MTSRIAVIVCAGVLALGLCTTTLRAQAPSGPREGIRVRGHWTITVRNADTSVASHTEFDNSLLPSGSTFLAQLLGRGTTFGNSDRWMVLLSGTPESYQIHEGTLPLDLKRPGIDFDGMSVLVPTSGSNALKLQLVGSARASVDNSIASVRTSVEHFDPNGKISSNTGFTNHTLGSPIAVVAGQAIDVTVVISFS